MLAQPAQQLMSIVVIPHDVPRQGNPDSPASQPDGRIGRRAANVITVRRWEGGQFRRGQVWQANDVVETQLAVAKDIARRHHFPAATASWAAISRWARALKARRARASAACERAATRIKANRVNICGRNWTRLG